MVDLVVVRLTVRTALIPPGRAAVSDFLGLPRPRFTGAVAAVVVAAAFLGRPGPRLVVVAVAVVSDFLGLPRPRFTGAVAAVVVAAAFLGRPG
ncbi:MAG: hypothetical protein AAFU67_10435, partial [Bacteroidota bacterium]